MQRHNWHFADDFPTLVVDVVQWILRIRGLKGFSDELRDSLRKDLNVVQRTLAKNRPPRIAILGAEDTPLSQFFESLLGMPFSDDLGVKEHLGRGRWYEYDVSDQKLEVLDARFDPERPEPTWNALRRRQADELVLLCTAAHLSMPGFMEYVDEIITRARNIYGTVPPVIIAPVSLADCRDPERRRAMLEHLISPALPESRVSVAPIEQPVAFADALIAHAPLEAKFPLAAMIDNPFVKRQVADAIINACAGVAATVATVPLPVADILPITSLQVLMISAIARLGGRELNWTTFREFAVALGLNVGAGYAMREVVRAASLLVPVAGSVISAGIASAATIALGRAAEAYFIPYA